MAEVGDRERWNRVFLLAAQMKCLAARGEDREVRGGLEEPTEQGHRVEELLQVVKHEEESEVPQVRLEGLHDGTRRLFAYADRLSDRCRDEARIGERRKVDEEDACRELRSQFLGDAKAQSRLAGAARTGQRHD